MFAAETSAAAPILAVSNDEFRLFRELIHRETGIHLNDAKRNLLASRLARRLRHLRLRTFSEYYDYLESVGGRADELRELINCITTNKTQFFREREHFVFLRQWLPRIAGLRPGRPVRIWSGACSTGEEPYSIAMTAADALAGGANGFRIVASDIDTEVLATAERGIYAEENLAEAPPEQRRKYFLRGVGDWAGYALVKPELKGQIEFRQVNLVRQPWPLHGRFDAIFLRNVVIYFDRETQRKLFERMASYLEPHGLLFVGSSESLFWLPDLFAPVGHAIYRLKPGSPVLLEDAAAPNR